MNLAPKLNRVIRLDSTPIGLASFTEEGYFKDRPILTSTGIFEYATANGGVRRELRLPEEVFDPESLASYKGQPVIITHDAGLIDKDNVAEEQIGTILSEGIRDGEDVRADIIIHDTDEMKKSGLKELSLGYSLELDETPGVWNGQKYDAIQRKIRINHLALVREARAGDQARLNLDSRDNTKLSGGKKAMAKIKKSSKGNRHDGILSPEELKKAVEEYKAKRAQVAADDEEEVVSTPAPGVEAKKDEDVEETKAPVAAEDAEEEVQTIKENVNEDGGLDAAEAQKLFDIVDSLLAKVDFDCGDGENCDEEDTDPADVNEDEDEDEAETKAMAEDEGEEEEELNEDDDDEPIPDTEASEVNLDSIDRMIRTRLQLRDVASRLNMDGLDNMPLKAAKKAVIQAVRPNIRLDGKSAAYINAAFDCAVSDVYARTAKDTGYQKRQMFNKDSASAKREMSSAESARQKMIDRRMNKKEGK